MICAPVRRLNVDHGVERQIVEVLEEEPNEDIQLCDRIQSFVDSGTPSATMFHKKDQKKELLSMLFSKRNKDLNTEYS